MKLVNLAVLAFASCILAKNIVYFDALVSAMNNDKREAKNIVSLDALKAASGSGVYEEEAAGNADPAARKRDEQDVFHMSAPLLQSLLPQVPQISVFSSYLRNDARMASQMENAGSFVLIVAPTDEAFARFSASTGKKPWEFPQEVRDDDTDDQVISANLRHFVEAHVSRPIDRELAENAPITLLSGEEMTIERLAGPDSYQVTVGDKQAAVASIRQAENGVVFVVDTLLV
ncbi:hypothetical protein METBIDRAFT_12108 [Metschnikowia bicuspidata var. bicuspidata NRRL YB-4993]|uniref:FAS1 domain-containing protein n=1 Tax=Metschnikowia bicuspidata var. bicuspidata NRRL YB-4993 TaxID=869754 RepID=A0A1A0HC89_9ASCO|nr:hypothetical protein METBIDRAFT_12108 [Metschnikowia bicuspidata var. bicuspidata NRRL YB-4993]OBA21621.1 hypothetical protein METBIDRAFT_12108 [Metschnikowia bicuspidata var. bicuspidata NRRL YB-4993]